MRFFISSNPQNLIAALAGLKSITIEAEYGNVVVEGSLETRAHHAPEFKHLPSPCKYENKMVDGLEAIGLSHFDLDSLGGTLAAIGQRPGPQSFWELAAFVDVNGPHRKHLAGASEQDMQYLVSFWAWGDRSRYFPPKDGSVIDAWPFIEEGKKILERVFNGDAELLQSGAMNEAEQRSLAKNSYRDQIGSVLIRKSEKFVNHMYEHGGSVFKSVVTFNPEKGSVTVSLESPVPGISCRSFVQELWGPEAGGHDGIAGSPRDLQMRFEDAEKAAMRLAALLG